LFLAAERKRTEEEKKTEEARVAEERRKSRDEITQKRKTTTFAEVPEKKQEFDQPVVLQVNFKIYKKVLMHYLSFYNSMNLNIFIQFLTLKVVRSF
jgi:hypothetical protein